MRRIEGPRDLPALREMLAEQTEGRAPRAPDPRTLYVLADTIRSSEMYWVTRDMTRLAVDGSHDLPEWTPAVARPEMSGLLVWQETLPTLHPRGLARSVSVPLRGVHWSTDPSTSTLSVLLLTDAVRTAAPDVAEVYPMVACDALSVPLHEPPVMRPDVLGVLPEAGPIIALLGATWLMMQEPKVTTRRETQPAKRDAERAARTGASRPLVTTIDLRALRHVHESAALSGSGRRLSVRHLVRGHWRQQYHPSDGTRRPKFIAPYIKGDPSLPLHLTDHVMVWRR